MVLFTTSITCALLSLLFLPTGLLILGRFKNEALDDMDHNPLNLYAFMCQVQSKWSHANLNTQDIDNSCFHYLQLPNSLCPFEQLHLQLMNKSDNFKITPLVIAGLVGITSAAILSQFQIQC